MTLGRWAWVLVAMAVCGCSHRRTISTTELRGLTRAGVMAGPAPAASDCADRATCEQQCENASPNACSRLGDFVYASDPGRAEQLWVNACRRRDGLGCYRLMSVAADEPHLADRLGLLACGYGEADACDFAVKSIFVRARDSDADLKSVARNWSSTFVAQCEAGSWWSCLMALEAVRKRDSEETKRLALRAFELAPRDCRRGEVAACHYAAAQYEEAGEPAPAKHLYALACGFLTGPNPSRTATAASTTKLCQRALSLGADIEHRDRAQRPGYIDASFDDVKAHRASGGSSEIKPPESVKSAMIRKDLGVLVGSLRLCVTSSGLVSDLGFNFTTGFPEYDRLAFNLVRQWRYRADDRDQLTPFCSNLTFIYRQG